MHSDDYTHVTNFSNVWLRGNLMVLTIYKVAYLQLQLKNLYSNSIKKTMMIVFFGIDIMDVFKFTWILLKESFSLFDLFSY